VRQKREMRSQTQKVVHRKHRQQTLVIDEEQPIQQHLTDIPATYVSYISHTHSLDNNTLLGNVIANYLIDTGTNPNANVVGIDKTGNFFSLYGFNLFEPIGAVLAGHLSLSRTNFDNNEQKMLALESLIAFLNEIDGKQYEDTELLNKAIMELRSIQPLPQPVQQVVRHSYGGVRNSIPYSAPVGTQQFAEFVDEDTTSSEEVVPVVTKRPTVIPVPQTQFVQSPFVQTPVVQTPIVQTPVVRSSVVRSPVAQRSVVRRTPVVKDLW
jgi:hypothetical protein